MDISKQLYQLMDEVYIREHRVLTEAEINAVYKLLKESTKTQDSSLLNESKIDDIIQRWKTLAGLEINNEPK